jgi:hypothetical protein
MARRPIRFRKQWISTQPFESAAAFDVDGDGVLDIVCGQFWYKGPDFRRQYEIAPISKHHEYFDDFSTIPIDVDRDGRLDFITGGVFGQTLRWVQNPGGDATKPWQVHEIAQIGPIETTRAWDLDGDGEPEIVPNTPLGPTRAFKLTGPGVFRAHTLHEAAMGHGFGCGDLAGNGRADLVLAHGWLEAPPDPLGGAPWTLHEDFDLGSASCPVIVADVTGDGVNDLIVGQAHEYGLHWWEHRIEAGAHRWIKHDIDPYASQYHDLHWADIDGDGQPELITGKRYRAHNGNDPGGHDPLGLYLFKWTGEVFAKQVVDFGTVPGASGLGIHSYLADLRGTGRLDLIAPGKEGLCVFLNEGVD